jgi:hypothetical protein
MIFIAGISPKTKRLDQNPQRCPVCGLGQAYSARIDHYLSLFFIPILRVKKGEAFMMCDHCEKPVGQLAKEYASSANSRNQQCRYCGRTLQKDFNYCPYCGKSR